MDEHRGSPPTAGALGGILNASLKSGAHLLQSHTRDFSHASSRFGDKDTSSSSDDDAGSRQSAGSDRRHRRRKSSRTFERVSRALSPYVSLHRPAKSRERPEFAVESTASSADEAGSAVAAGTVVTPSESALAAEPGSAGVANMFGMRDAIRRKLSIARRDRTSSSAGEGGYSCDDSDSALLPVPSSFRAAGIDDIAHLMNFSEKTNKEIHRLFPELTELDVHVDDYTCAVQKEILIQGRLYLTNRHVCFAANLFGYTTCILLPFTNIATIEKKTFLMIPSAIQITTKDDMEYFFPSFVLRDQAYIKMVALLHASRKAQSHQNVLAEIEAAVVATAAAAAANNSALSKASVSPPPPVWETVVSRYPQALLAATVVALAIALLGTLSCGAMAWKIWQAIDALDHTIRTFEVVNDRRTQ
ncbi:hypothetical protein HDU86_000669 [Geranomyces michiganensis]|nr:hypothetical protein HDU86_000669 [Geranomyces michiganensis]